MSDDVDQDAMADDWAAAMEEQAEVDGPPSRDEPEAVEEEKLVDKGEKFNWFK